MVRFSLTMETNDIKLLLDSQERAFRSAVDVIVQQFEGRISSMETTISDLTTSLEYTQAELQDMKREAVYLKKSNSDNQSIIQDNDRRTADLEQRLNYQEDYSRRNNLRISGLEEPQHNETWEQTSARVSELLLNKLQLPNMNLERAHRVGPVSTSRPRTVVVRFERFGDREAVLRNARKLRGTGIFINEDLCAASQAKKQSQFPLMKEARSQGKIAYFKYTRLIIKDRMGQQSNGASNDAASASSGAFGGMTGVSKQRPGGADVAAAGSVTSSSGRGVRTGADRGTGAGAVGGAGADGDVAAGNGQGVGAGAGAVGGLSVGADASGGVAADADQGAGAGAVGGVCASAGAGASGGVATDGTSTCDNDGETSRNIRSKKDRKKR